MNAPATWGALVGVVACCCVVAFVPWIGDKIERWRRERRQRRERIESWSRDAERLEDLRKKWLMSDTERE